MKHLPGNICYRKNNNILIKSALHIWFIILSDKYDISEKKRIINLVVLDGDKKTKNYNY